MAYWWVEATVAGAATTAGVLLAFWLERSAQARRDRALEAKRQAQLVETRNAVLADVERLGKLLTLMMRGQNELGEEVEPEFFVIDTRTHVWQLLGSRLVALDAETSLVADLAGFYRDVERVARHLDVRIEGRSNMALADDFDVTLDIAQDYARHILITYGNAAQRAAADSGHFNRPG